MVSLDDALYRALRDHLGDQPITIPVEFDQGHINVTYRILLPEQATVPDEPKDLAKWVAKYVEAWDLLDDDEQPIPFTEQALGHVPIDILRAVNIAVGEDMSRQAEKFRRSLESKNSPALARVQAQREHRLVNRKGKRKGK